MQEIAEDSYNLSKIVAKKVNMKCEFEITLKVKDKDELVDDRNGRECFRAERADHHIIQQVNEIGNTVLDHNGNGDAKDPFIERRRSDKLFQFHTSSLKYACSSIVA